MVSLVTWMWEDKHHDRKFLPEYYNILFAMLSRHITLPEWRLVVIGDSAKGLDSGIHFEPLPATKAVPVRNPFGARFPSCYQRLWLFSEEAKRLGQRVINIDVDAVIVGNIDHLLSRTENFVGWTDPQFKWKKIAGGLYSLATGTHTQVWDDFDPVTSPEVAKKTGNFGSDQGWMSHKLYPPEGRYSRSDGAYYAKWLPANGKELNDEARIIQTPGELKPWTKHSTKVYPWMRTHWRT